MTISGPWPELPWTEWKDTCATLHMWTQIVGKTRLAFTPLENHWWEVPLYVSARGLTTSAIPWAGGILDAEFDFIEHRLLLRTSTGATRQMKLEPRSVADFYREYMRLLGELGIEFKMYPVPVEIPDPVPFAKDTVHASYDPEYAHRFWQVLLRVDTVLKEFRSGFVGKSSPVHFFWGSFDLAVTRFNGKRAPARPDADPITREAYSHEVISCGFWPGNGGFGTPAFYCYAAPEPAGLKDRKISPDAAYYDPELKEFVLKYDDVRTSAAPERVLLDFCQSTYDAAASLAQWDGENLERRDKSNASGRSAL